MDLTSFILVAFLAGSAWLYVLMVVVGLGLIIFVHELGHFLVAKACGVKCEKFYLGFDIFGLRIARFRWGETEYGIGILPLGGYVKMLGQEDNPARLRQELERARSAGLAPDAVISEEGVTVAAAQAALYDPRSYLAKSVPQRMAIISAGVIMNLIFAFIVAVIAFAIGVDEFPCTVGQVAPGEGAWRAGIQPGDRIIAINGRQTMRFQDIQQTIPLTRRGAEVALTVERLGRSAADQLEKSVFDVRIVPDRIRVIPTIGVSNAFTTELADPPCFPGSPAAALGDQLKPGWKIVRVNDRPIADYAELHRQWALTWGQSVEITLESPEEPHTQGNEAKKVTLRLDPSSVRDLGLVLEYGRIVAVQADSPAAQAGIQPGDELVAVECPADIVWDGDLLELPYVLQKTLRERQGANVPVVLSIRRSAQEEPAFAEDDRALKDSPHTAPPGENHSVTVPARLASSFAELYTPDSPWEIPQLGIAVEILPRVRAVRPKSPAAEADIQPGDVIVAAKTISPRANVQNADAPAVESELEVRFDVQRGNNKATWATFFHELQKFPLGTQVELVLRRAKGSEKSHGDASDPEAAPQELTVRLEPHVRNDWYFPDRQLLFQPMTFHMRAGGFFQAIEMGASETWTSVTLIYRILNRLTRGDVSPRALVGPIGLVQTAYRVASQGTGRFLLFLTLLSANLAVVNFLPIPVLDGGHMVFLLYEAIRGKPPSEAVYVGLSYLGLAIILGIMLWVFGLDLGLIAR
ncbi:Membrane-associated zinc metalloprotease [Thermogutta terrifontis]|uniref:Membrane-associated zinc metalloprotease n=1 Tax=Thermogutta terrifontis TaxID=1331910 RepID=A0A286RBT9_9BACT|nr:site-2 protease family protein [Thermogutta terrifontis]ASV73432.1 Membrane-associated zinc metalloprotease [Thermogutta terrifontis]